MLVVWVSDVSAAWVGVLAEAVEVEPLAESFVGLGAAGLIAAPPDALALALALELELELVLTLVGVDVSALAWIVAVVVGVPHALPVGCCCSISLITESIREPEPIGPGG